MTIDLTDPVTPRVTPAPAPAPALAAPAPPAPPVEPRRRAGAFKRWRARLVVVLMIAAAVYGGLRIADVKAADAARLNLGTVTLTAEAVPVQSLRPGRVLVVKVRAQERVTAGQELGRLLVLTTSPSTGEVRETETILRAPTNGVVSDEPVRAGTVLQAGDAFVRLYDPANLKLVANVPLDQLARLTPGMRATLTGADLPRPLHATVGRVVPRVGDAESDVRSDHLAVELSPDERSYVAQLVPGLRFTGTVDTRTRPDEAQRSVYIGR